MRMNELQERAAHMQSAGGGLDSLAESVHFASLPEGVVAHGKIALLATSMV